MLQAVKAQLLKSMMILLSCCPNSRWHKVMHPIGWTMNASHNYQTARWG